MRRWGARHPVWQRLNTPAYLFSLEFEVIEIPKLYFLRVFAQAGVRWRSGSPAEGTAI